MKKMIVIIMLVLLVAVSVNPVYAGMKGVISGGYVGCLTEAYLDEYTGYQVTEDRDGARALFNKVCFNIKGKRYSVIDWGFIVTKVRVYAGETSVVLWTPSEAVK